MTEFFLHWRGLQQIWGVYKAEVKSNIPRYTQIHQNIFQHFDIFWAKLSPILRHPGKIECILHPIPLTANMDQVARFCDAKFLSNGALSALFTVCKIFLVKRCQRKQIVQLRQEADVLASVCSYLTHTFNPDLIFWSADQMFLRLVLLLLNVQTYSSHGDHWSMYETPI